MDLVTHLPFLPLLHKARAASAASPPWAGEVVLFWAGDTNKRPFLRKDCKYPLVTEEKVDVNATGGRPADCLEYHKIFGNRCSIFLKPFSKNE